MRKTLATLLLAPLLLAGCLTHSPKNMVSIPSQNTETLPVCLHSKKLTTAHYTLEMERFLGAEDRDFQKMENFLDSAQKRIIIRGRYSVGAATNILDTIYQESKSLFKYYEIGDVFYTSLRTGKADCERFAIPFVSVAQRLDLPIVAVQATDKIEVSPKGVTNVLSHVFIRWKFSDKTNDWINYECQTGLIKDIKYYQGFKKIEEIYDFNRWCIDTRLIWCSSLYGTNLPQQQLKAYSLIRSLKN